MITDNLFKSILINPAIAGANRCYIVSGYATSAMAFHHIQALEEKKIQIEIKLIVGMTRFDGISQSNHRGFEELSKNYKEQFVCSYVMRGMSVHSKVYAWYKDDEPIIAYLGSANYSQTAFRDRREALTSCTAKDAFDYFYELEKDTIFCNHNDVENIIKLQRQVTKRVPEQTEPWSEKDAVGLESIKVSLLAANGEIHQHAGLNWGQRLGREKNQAYIPLRSEVYGTDFFPERGIHFTMLTDDGKVLVCTRAQANGKAIHTPHNNSLIGEYFRNRLGLKNGAFVNKEDLKDYGREDITFYKIDDETYYMDFSTHRDR